MSEKRISRKELARQNRKKNKKRKNLRTLMIIAITAVLVYITGIYGASLAYLGDFVASGLTYLQVGSGFPVEDDYSTLLQGGDMGSGLALLTSDNFLVYSPTGKNVFSYSHSMSQPVMDSSDNRAVIYQSGGTSLKIANHQNILFHKEMPNSIIHADISDSNRVAVTTRSDSYNGEVVVYNYNMDQRFVWYCARGFPVYSLLSDSGRTMAVCAVQTVNGLLQSDVYVIDAVKGVEKVTISGGAYPQKMIFLDDDRLMLVYADKLVIKDTRTGEDLAIYQSENGKLLAVENSSPYIAVATGSYTGGTSSKVIMMAVDFTEKFTAEIPEKVKDLSVSRSRLYVLGEKTLYEYDYSGTLLSSCSTGSLTHGLVTWNGTILMDSTALTKVEKTKSR
ncbi:MAG: hypothetical protein IKU54_02765 [Oscillospiraceae bacterium]|nr:hypothetical protein [Oscillospiraceae bacterium]